MYDFGTNIWLKNPETATSHSFIVEQEFGSSYNSDYLFYWFML